jgi:glycosyltransferase involved in cell wall biosynthesis
MLGPTVSVIIPYFNSEKTLGRAIESVLNQRYPILEIILIDNNSIDDSRHIAYEYSKKYPDKFLLLSETIQNANAARNKGLFAARGLWLQFLDSDDEIMPDKISGQISCIMEEDDAEVVVSPYTRLFFSVTKNTWIPIVKREISTDFVSGLLHSQLGCTISNLWQKKALIDVGGWDNNLTSGQEYGMLINLIMHNKKFAFLDENKSIAYLSDDSITQPKNPEKEINLFINRLKYTEKIKKLFVEKGLFNKEIQAKLDDIVLKNYILTYFRLYKLKDKVLSVGRQYNIHLSFKYQLKMYPHYIYSKYAFNTKYKYVNFAWHFFGHLYMLMPLK